MQIISTREAMRAAVAEARGRGLAIAFVPTMGALHEGHLALVDAARRAGDIVVMSIFVNPLQFRPGEDFANYPRRLDADAELARGRGVDLLFAPGPEEMYQEGAEVRVVAGATASRWEGAHRPGHFDGVLTVVAKLFHLVQPDVAFFGRKDIQQATLIRRLVADLDFPVRIDVVPTIRDPDGLALSSRNAFLSAGDRARALALSRALFTMREAWEQGERSTPALVALGEAVLGDLAPDYLSVVDPHHLAPVQEAESGSVVIVACRVGTTRLIDNTILGDANA
jgi:pantoate--beta-alanine ligase